jgi:hypothetical protein
MIFLGGMIDHQKDKLLIANWILKNYG